jgi:hypothetical protein
MIQVGAISKQRSEVLSWRDPAHYQYEQKINDRRQISALT